MDLFGDSNDTFDIGDLFEKPISPLEDLNLENPEAAVAFLACNPDSDYANFVATLSLTMAVPVVGVTSVGQPFETASEPFGSHLSFMGKKDTNRSIAASEPLDSAKAGELMTDLYNRCVAGLPGEPKLFLLFTPLLPNLFIDEYLFPLFDLCGKVPVIGGMASDDLHSTRTAAFAFDKAYKDRIVLMALSGDIRPAFGVGCEITSPSAYTPVVTKADKNVIYRVDDMTFAEYMEKLGFGPEEATSDFPLSVRLHHPGSPMDEECPSVSSVVGINTEDGSGTLANMIEPGSVISAAYINRDNIANSTRSAVAKLKSEMEAISQTGYQFDTLFAISCVARYYTMLSQPNVEAEILNAELSTGMAGFGFYAFKEIGPLPNGSGGLKNERHGQSIVLCAI